jgi:hypothetical protein
MNKITLALCMSLLLSLKYVHANDIQTAVLVRHPEADVKLYYQRLQLQLQFITPIKALEQQWQHASLTEDWLRKLNSLDPTTEDSKIKELLKGAPASMELYEWINEFSSKQKKHNTNTISCEGIDYRLKQMRQVLGGEDLQLYVNGDKWQCQDLLGHTWIHATLISSSWSALVFVGRAKELENWLHQQKFVQSWVSGTPESYKWSHFQFLRSYRRAIYWPTGESTADNWFDPQAIYFNNQPSEEPKSTTWAKYGLIAAGGVILWNALRGKQLVVEF